MVESDQTPSLPSWISDRIPAWDVLIAMSRNKIVNSSYVFLFVTPIAAKVTQHLPDLVEIPVGSGYQFTIALPFSWLWLFWCALAASVANLIVVCRCPEIVSKYRDWADFERSAKGDQELRSLAKQVACARYPFASARGRASDAMHLSAAMATGLKDSRPTLKEVEDEVLADNFNGLRGFGNTCRHPWRLAASVLYMIAVSCFCWIVFRNICFVVGFICS